MYYVKLIINDIFVNCGLVMVLNMEIGLLIIYLLCGFLILY